MEQNFREQHSVSYYAGLLHKSPKTITNTFKKINEKSPLQIIHDRILLEAKNLLQYTKLDISEIAYDLGFENVQVFSRFFKRLAGIPPTEFRLIRNEAPFRAPVALNRNDPTGQNSYSLSDPSLFQ